MRKLSVVISVIIAILGTNTAFAQVVDPLNQNKKVHGEWSSESETVISKKKNNLNKEESKNTDDKSQTAVKSNVKISNSCPDDITVELLSLSGNKSSQEVTITIRFTNHRINEYIYIRHFLAFNQDGDEFSDYTIGGFNTLTDVPQKTSWKVGQMLPSRNSKLTALSFKIGGCVIEMRDVPIDWK